MKRAAKVDANHNEIVNGLRQCPGVTVHPTGAVAKGFPDICVGLRGRTYLFEIKDGSKVPSAQKLTKDQEIWHGNWTGHVAIIRSLDDALYHLGFL